MLIPKRKQKQINLSWKESALLISLNWFLSYQNIVICQYVSISKRIFHVTAIDKQLCIAQIKVMFIDNEGLDLEAIQVHKQLSAEEYALCNYSLINDISRFFKILLLDIIGRYAYGFFSWLWTCIFYTLYQCRKLFEAPLDPIFSFSIRIPASFISFICRLYKLKHTLSYQVTFPAAIQQWVDMSPFP